MRSDIEIGGKDMLFLGDFWQKISVVSLGFRARITTLCFKNSPTFPPLKVLYPSKNMRYLALQQNHNAGEEALAFPNYCWMSEMGPFRKQKIAKPNFHHALTKKAQFIKSGALILLIVSKNYWNTDFLIPKAAKVTENIVFRAVDYTVLHRFPGEKQKFLSCDTVETKEKIWRRNTLPYLV